METLGAALLLAHGEPAGGAALGEIVAGSAVGAVLGALALALGWAHRTGRTTVLARLAGFSGRVTGLPGWAALPMAVTTGSLLVAVFGFYWDVATHIDNGRDPGPFANPSHYLIIFGLLGIAFAGFLSVVLGRDDAGRSVRIREGWHAPVGGILLLVCGSIAVAGFPLDDVWHRLFGQDVTLWSPTHIQMVGGAALSTLALLVLIAEGERAAESPVRWFKLVSGPMSAGALLLGFSALQAEFDYSVPQFRILYHPILLMLSAGAALVAARMRVGRGGALAAVAFFLAVRGILTIVIGPGMDHTMPHFPLYLVEAIAVEVVALFVDPKRAVAFGATAGLAIGTFGLAAEWGWSHLWMTMPWTQALLPEALVMGPLAAVAGGVLGGYIGAALEPRLEASPPTPRWIPVVTGAAIVACLVIPFPIDADLRGSARVELEAVEGRPGWANATIALDPRDAAADAEWFNVTSWQGGGSVIQDPVPLGDGVYRTASPIPVSGEWKTQMRLQKGASLMALPIYLPEDPGIPAEGVPAPPTFTREFASDKELLLREAKEVEPWLTATGSIVIGLIALVWVATLGWGLERHRSSMVAHPSRAAAVRRRLAPARSTR